MNLQQFGGVMGVTFLVVNLLKQYIPEQHRKYIPLLAILIAGGINVLVSEGKPLTQSLGEGLLMGLANGKINDISKKDIDPFAEEKQELQDLTDYEDAHLVGVEPQK